MTPELDKNSELRKTIVRTALLVAIGFLFLYFSTLPTYTEMENARKVGLAAREAMKTGNPTLVDDAVFLTLHRIERRSVVTEFLFHLAIAMFVAAAIVLIVEFHSRQRMHEELDKSAARMNLEAEESRKRIEAEMAQYRQLIGLNVFEALFKRRFPTSVVNGLEAIFDSRIVKQNVRYIIKLFRYKGMPQDRIVVRRTTSFTAANVTHEQVDYHVRSTIQSTPAITCNERGEEFSVPRHVSFTVNGTNAGSSDGMRIEHVLSLDPKGTARVFMVAEEHYAMHDHAEYVQMTLSSDVVLTVDNTLRDEIACDVSLLHPKLSEFQQADDHGDYRCEGAIVPGQAILVEWKPLPSVESQKA